MPVIHTCFIIITSIVQIITIMQLAAFTTLTLFASTFAKQTKVSSGLLSQTVSDDLPFEETQEILAFECANECASLNRDCSYQIYVDRDNCASAEYRNNLKYKTVEFDIDDETSPKITKAEFQQMNEEQCMQFRSDVIDARFGYLQQGLGCTEVNQCLRECGVDYSWIFKVVASLALITVVVLVMSAILNSVSQRAVAKAGEKR